MSVVDFHFYSLYYIDLSMKIAIESGMATKTNKQASRVSRISPFVSHWRKSCRLETTWEWGSNDRIVIFGVNHFLIFWQHEVKRFQWNSLTWFCQHVTACASLHCSGNLIKTNPDMTPVRKWNGSLHCLGGPRAYNVNLIFSFHPSSRWYYILGISFPPSRARSCTPDDSICLSGLYAVPGTHAGSQAVWRSFTISSQSASVALSGPERAALLVVHVVKSSPTPSPIKWCQCFGQGFSDPL